MDERGEGIDPKTLKEGFLYRIHARNAKVGIFRKNDVRGMNGFEIARNKFGYRLDFEYEWGQHERFGTAYALKEIGAAEVLDDPGKRLKYLIHQELSIALDGLENWQKKASEAQREVVFAQQTVDRIRENLIPTGTWRGTWGCDESPIHVCIYEDQDTVGDHCIYCGEPDERK